MQQGTLRVSLVSSSFWLPDRPQPQPASESPEGGRRKRQREEWQRCVERSLPLHPAAQNHVMRPHLVTRAAVNNGRCFQRGSSLLRTEPSCVGSGAKQNCSVGEKQHLKYAPRGVPSTAAYRRVSRRATQRVGRKSVLGGQVGDSTSVLGAGGSTSVLQTRGRSKEALMLQQGQAVSGQTPGPSWPGHPNTCPGGQ